MRVVDVKKLKYQDTLAKKRQRRFLAVSAGAVVAAVAIVIGLGYVLFFSHWFDIKNVSVDGLADARAQSVQQAINDRLAHHWLGLPTGKNILFLSDSGTAKWLSANFSFIKTVSVSKKMLHGLIIQATERQPEGIWCFPSASSGQVPSCSYYDHGGVLIAPAPQSSGYLMLTVNDQRAGVQTIDPKFLASVQTIAAGLAEQNIKVKDMTIPADTFTELDADSSGGYPIKFSIDSDLAAQLHALKIFLGQNSGPFQYVDLRFDARVYYK